MARLRHDTRSNKVRLRDIGDRRPARPILQKWAIAAIPGVPSNVFVICDRVRVMQGGTNRL